MFFKTVRIWFRGVLTIVKVPCEPSTPMKQVEAYALQKLKRKHDELEEKKREKISNMNRQLYHGGF